MVRIAAALILSLALAACQSEDAPASRAEVMQNAGDNRIAKTLFGAAPRPSAQAPAALGGYSQGCQAGAVALPETGPTWQAMRLSRNRNWAQPVTVDYVQDLSRFAATLPGWNGLYVGDLSQPRGGPMLTGHASHQTGLDADIWMLPATRLDLNRAERESLSSISMQRASGAYVNNSWTPQHEALIRAAASDPRTARIFVFAGAKVEMCNNAAGDRSWLNKVRPWYGHHYHFHVRLNCPPGDASCVDQAPPPPGDGCAEAQEWVNNIISPPPPTPRDPSAAPVTPRGELTMARLPGQCLAVLNAN
ncbi:MAG: penicillin-insensitive murein endopeptidase [Loktanella sp.]|nr:penicillin-insensitive murein endopeptidase [Loktanella sp.]